jgi:hypothetical protein
MEYSRRKISAERKVSFEREGLDTSNACHVFEREEMRKSCHRERASGARLVLNS